ncbi:MAG: hypothetical protein GYA57_06020 [Myxococcales bacterium]|nr:hypothetical protein [Myxococcales bacterium]
MDKRTIVPFCLALLAGPPAAHASEPALVILPVQHNLTGDANRVTGEVMDKVAESLTAQGYSVLPRGSVEECGADAGTTERAALAAAAGRCHTQAAVGLRIDASAMGYNLRFVLVGYEGTVVSDEESSCDFCTEQEMIAKWGELAAAAGAPPEALLAPPEEGSEPTTEEPVEPPPVVVVEEPASSFGIEDVPWWFWAGAGASLAVSLGVGLPLILIDGEPTCDGPLESCPELYDTDALGYTMLAVGIAGLAAVGVGLYLVIDADGGNEEAQDEDEPEAEIALVPGPGGLLLRGEF